MNETKTLMEDKPIPELSGISFSVLSDQSIRTDLIPLQNESISESDDNASNSDGILLFEEVRKRDKDLSTLFSEEELYAIILTFFN